IFGYETGTVSISGGIATINSEFLDQVFAGQRLEYGADNRVVFVRSCSSPFQCEVTTPTGGVPADVTGAPLKVLRHEFSTLAEAIASAPDSNHLGTSDLAAARVALEISVHNTGVIETTPLVIDGWATGLETPITIRAAPNNGHLGRYTSGAVGLEVAGGPCIRSTVGNLVLEWLQLYCSADPATDLAGVLLDGPGVSGRVELRESIVRLDGASGAGERLGVAAPSVGELELAIRNTVFYDLGSGTARHAGLLVEGDSVDATVANATVIGGEYGLRRTAGSLTAVNTLIEGSGTACFAGEMAAGSSNNISSDATAPGPGSATGVSGWMVGPLTGGAADQHLDCNPAGSAAVASSTINFGSLANLFDGNPRSIIRTAAVNPAFVEVDFGAPLVLEGTAVAFGFSTAHRWSMAVADSPADMAARSGSYRVVVSERAADGSGLPDPNYLWDEVELMAPETARVVRLEVEKLVGDSSVHLGEWSFVIGNSPCDGGTDLSTGPAGAYAFDLDGQWRADPWDVGSDEASLISVTAGSVNSEVWESEGEAVVEVLLSSPPRSEARFGYRTRPFSATENLDFTPVAGELVFEPGRLRREIRVPIAVDTVADDYEDFAVELFAPGDAGFVFTGAQVQLVDGTPPVRAFLDPGTVVVDESSGSAIVTVQLSRAAVSDVTVTWASADGGALMGLDFGGVNGEVVINAGATAADIAVPVFDDELVESDESFLVRLVSANGGVLVGPPSHSEIVIIDNEPPAVGFRAPSYSVLERAGQAVVTVELNKPVAGDVQVDFAVAAGTASAGQDFEPASGTLTIPAGGTTGTFAVAIVDDALVEDDETVLLTLSNASGAALGSTATATLTIRDDDGVPSVAFASPLLQVAEAAGTALLEIVVTGNPVADVGLTVTVSDGSAVSGADFGAVPTSLTIPFGESSAVIPVPIIDDGLPELDESFTVTISDPVNAALGQPASTTVTILGDLGQPRLNLSPVSRTVDEQAGLITLQAVLDTTQATAVSVRARSVDGEARASSDYVAVDEILTIPAGQTSQSLGVLLLDDTVFEGPESFQIILSEPTGGAGLGPDWQATVTISANDSPPFVYLADGGETTARYTALEPAGEIVIPVRLSAASEVEARVDYATAAGTATAGTDYTDVSGSLVFAPGVTRREIAVPIVADGIDDDGETFTLTLSNPAGCALDSGPLPSDGVVTIVDGLPEVLFAQPAHLVQEGDLVSFEVVLSEPSDVAVEVAYQTVAGTAASGIDYNARSGVLHFEPGQTSASTASVLIRTDGLVEDDELFTIELRDPSSALLGVPASATVTIVDRNTFQAFGLQAVHIEHDLVHLKWRQTPFVSGDSLIPAGWEVSRRDANLGGTWEILAATSAVLTPTFWRDFSIPPDGHWEYRVVPLYDPNSGPDVRGEEETWAMSGPPPAISGEADQAPLPGFAVFASGEALPAAANAFAGRHDYAFTLLPDPGPEFSNATVDVYLDDVPAAGGPDEAPQPWTAPFSGRGRDDRAEIATPGTKVVDA
ncbi:MAG TPA: Calx-beta domain-containing protein, partial [Chondromyces sp.]|nr:Calx-beta domain-containing protein [Chondromyces sp.]